MAALWPVDRVRALSVESSGPFVHRHATDLRHVPWVKRVLPTSTAGSSLAIRHLCKRANHQSHRSPQTLTLPGLGLLPVFSFLVPAASGRTLIEPPMSELPSWPWKSSICFVTGEIELAGTLIGRREYQACPPRVVCGAARHAATASSQ
jgi:hypothetical protein